MDSLTFRSIEAHAKSRVVPIRRAKLNIDAPTKPCASDRGAISDDDGVDDKAQKSGREMFRGHDCLDRMIQPERPIRSFE